MWMDLGEWLVGFFNSIEKLITLAEEGKLRIWMWLTIVLATILPPIVVLYWANDYSPIFIFLGILILAPIGFVLSVWAIGSYIEPPKREDPDKEDYQKYMHHH